MTETKLNRLNEVRDELVRERRYLKALKDLDKSSDSYGFSESSIKAAIRETEDKIKRLTKEFEEG